MADAADGARHTSLRYLRLKNDFRSMMKSGMDSYDEQTFKRTFTGQEEARHLEHVFRLISKQKDAIVEVAAMEMEAACNEVSLQQQLEELEALILQRGLLGSEYGPTDPTALPSAAEAAARVAAKQAEKQQLQETLQDLLKQQADVQANLEQKQQQAQELLKEYKEVENQVDKVYKAGKQWLQPTDGQQALKERQ